MTPWELERWCKGVAEAERQRYRLALWQAWHGDSLRRRKRLKGLGETLRKLDRRRRRKLTPDQIWAEMSAGFRGLGGVDQAQAPS